jgi:hypothetical protein
MTAPCQDSRHQSQRRGETKPHGSQRAVQPYQGEQRQSRNRETDRPYCDQATGHRVALSFGVQMRYKPAARAAVTSSRNQVGVFPERLPERNPSQAHTHGEYHDGEESHYPNQERGPWRRGCRAQERKQYQSEPSEPGSEKWKAPETGWSESELLDHDPIAEFSQMSGYQLASGSCLDGTSFSAEGEDLGGDLFECWHMPGFPDQDDAARFGRLPLTNAVPAAARAARLVSSVI